MTTNLTAAPTTGITLRRAADRGQADHGWLKSGHSFSFADYYDPNHMGFRSLRVINDDVVAGGGGFPTHPHRDMEIITYVLQGALQHRDSMGNGSVIRPGNVQYMAAGTGVQHSEFNASPTEPVHLLQIWIRPNRTGLPPRYQEKSLGDVPAGRLQLVASSSGREDSIAINQDADLWIGRLQTGESVLHTLAPKRHAWIQVATGSVTLNGLPLSAGDGASVSGETLLRLSASHAAQVLLFDLN
jgi:redox-sensitive bicupin YhaK (pirin superfamily)